MGSRVWGGSSRLWVRGVGLFILSSPLVAFDSILSVESCGFSDLRRV
jgi:hypothetical protein